MKLISKQLLLEILPRSSIHSTTSSLSSPSITVPVTTRGKSTNCDNKMKSYLFWFSNEHSSFRMPELEALFSLFDINQEILRAHKSLGPFVLLDFPNDEPARKLMSRSVLAHSCYELWTQASSLEELHNNLKNNLQLFEQYNLPPAPLSFRFRVDTFGKTIHHTEKLKYIDTFDYVPLDGKVDLVNPELPLHLINFYGLDPNKATEIPRHLFFGRWIADSSRKLASKLTLKTRKFIGNTSMDPLLSILMANLGIVKEDDVVCDPFVGTGSLLVAAAALGGYVCGGDIAYLIIHAKTRPSRAFQKSREADESIRANLKQYGLESKFLDILVSDASKPPWRSELKFDVIITDPPYGIREPTEKIGTEKGYTIKEEHLAFHVPSKVAYSLTEIFIDLIDFGAKYLVMNGRLVFWIPISRTDYDPEKLPQNPCFELVSNCEQLLTAFAARRLLVYKKIAEPTEKSQTIFDGSGLMFRFKFFESGGMPGYKNRVERKCISNAYFGKGGKRGPMLSSEEQS